MSNIVDVTDCRKKFPFELAEFIRSQGLYISDNFSTEVALPSPDLCFMGILHADPSVKPERRFLVFRAKPRKRMLGFLWFWDKDRDEKLSIWIFNAYGTTCADLVQKTMEDIGKQFNVTIKIRVHDENSFERYFHEGLGLDSD